MLQKKQKPQSKFIDCGFIFVLTFKKLAEKGGIKPYVLLILLCLYIHCLSVKYKNSQNKN